VSASRAAESALVAAWESAALGRSVTHAEHLRIAWELLRRHGVEEGKRRIVDGTRANCESAGVPERFDRALSERWADRIADALANRDPPTFETFAATHPELFQSDHLGRPAWHEPPERPK
jgi:hypothetical protein